MLRPDRAWRGNLEIAIALVLLAWRLTGYPLSTLYRDWVALLSIYWIFTAQYRESRLWPWVTNILVLWLMALYSRNQVPLILDGLRLLS